MRIKKGNIFQIASFVVILFTSIMYALYIKGLVDFRIVSPSDLNPYGGWSHLKDFFTDVSYRWRGITKGISLSLAITITSLVAGRFLCGNICPIGSIQDFSNYMGKKLKIKQVRVGNNKVLDLIKYLVLIIVLGLSTIGLGYRVAPFSPWLGLLNFLSGKVTLIGISILLLILITSLFIKRLFCRFLCPLGAYQSLISVLGLYKIKTNAKCEGCNYCLKDCVVELKSKGNKELPPECVSCLRCVSSKCIKDPQGYQVHFGNKRLSENIYLISGLVILLGFYIILPMAFSNNTTGWTMENLNLKDGVYIGVGSGFGGRIMTEVTIREESIENIFVRSHKESSGYFEEVYRNLGMDIKSGQNLNVDIISGATATSRGYIGAVRNAISQSMEQKVGE